MERSVSVYQGTMPRKSTAKKLKRTARTKWKMYYFVLLGLFRLYHLAMPRLNKKQRHRLTLLYEQNASQMGHPLGVHRVLTDSGISIGLDDLKTMLKIDKDGNESSWFKTGRVLKAEQFVHLGKKIHAKFNTERRITDSQEAFTALNGDISDPTSYLDSNHLKEVFAKYHLLGDSAAHDAAIRKLDADGGGQIE